MISGGKLMVIQSREQRYPKGLSAREKEAQSLPRGAYLERVSG